jgi:hypothetical protein
MASMICSSLHHCFQLADYQPTVQARHLCHVWLCRQHIYLSMACRNPRRGLMCEPPAIKRIDFYCHSDLSLAGFIVAAAPHSQKKCQVRMNTIVLYCVLS